MNDKVTQAVSLRSSPMAADKKEPASSKGQGAGFVTSAAGEKHVLARCPVCGSATAVVRVVGIICWLHICPTFISIDITNKPTKSANDQAHAQNPAQ